MLRRPQSKLAAQRCVLVVYIHSYSLNDGAGSLQSISATMAEVCSWQQQRSVAAAMYVSLLPGAAG